MKDIFAFLTSTPIVSINIFCGIISFILTVYVALRTAGIRKALQYERASMQFKHSQKGLKGICEGYRKSITEDKITTFEHACKIVEFLEMCISQYGILFNIKERFYILRTIYHLKRTKRKAKFDKVAIWLAQIGGKMYVEGK